MNILLVSTQDYIHHPIPSRHHNIFEELATRHTVHVPHFHVSTGPERDTRLVVHEATTFPVHNPLLHYTLNAPTHFRVFDRIIREEEIDVVVGAHVLAGTAMVHAAKKNHRPVIFDLKDWFPDSAAAYYDNPLLKRVIHGTVHAVTRYNLARSDVITTVSPGLVSLLADDGFTARLIPNGVNTALFRPRDGAGMRDALGIPGDALVIGFAGAVERWYALDDLIDLLPRVRARHPGAVLLVVGGSLFTRYREELEARARDRGVADAVIFTGAVPYTALPEYIAAMDICTIPLRPAQWIQIALPNKYFEYSACGKPILTTPIPDVMAMGGSHVRTYQDQGSILDGIDAFAASGAPAPVDVEEHSWAHRARAFEALFEEIIT
ncbi:MAG: glycosyltransferase [Methanomicrobiales archaeon]